MGRGWGDGRRERGSGRKKERERRRRKGEKRKKIYMVGYVVYISIKINKKYYISNSVKGN